MFFFKRKLSPEGWSQRLLQVLSHLLQNVEKDPLLRETDIDIKVIGTELVFLLAFATDYGTTLFLDNSQERDTVLDHYLSALVKYFARKGNDAKFLELLEMRHNRYFTAIGKEAEKIPESVAEEFARFCGYENDTLVISYGQIEFMRALKRLKELFGKYSVKMVR